MIEPIRGERIALVTGAPTGIGRAVCRRLARPGARLVLTTRGNEEGLAETAAEAPTAEAHAVRALLAGTEGAARRSHGT